MQIRLILALAIIVLAFWLMARYRRLPSHQRKQFLVKAGVITFVSIMVLAVLTGRVHWLGGLLAAAVGFAKFGFNVYSRFFPFLRIFGKKAFGNPVFSTAFLRVQVNLDNNHITGVVIDGPYKDQALEALDDKALAELEAHYQNIDKRSYYLIRVLRQRADTKQSNHNNRQHEQHEQHEQQTYSSVGDPSLEEALQILGLDNYSTTELPDRKTVIDAHRRLIQKLHPDRGGNDYLAARVNLAKDSILARLK